MERCQKVTYQDRAEWLEARAGGIGASEAGVILGLTPDEWGTPWSLWAEKTGKAKRPDVTSQVAQDGVDLESYIKARYARETGRSVIDLPSHTIYWADDPCFMFCTPDALAEDPALGAGLLQCKSAAPIKTDEWDGDVPDAYLAQVLHEMAVTGAKWASLAVVILRFPLQFRVYDVVLEGAPAAPPAPGVHGVVTVTPDMLDALKGAVGEFWNLVLTDTPPAVDGAGPTSKAVRKVFRPQDGAEPVPLPLCAAAWDEELVQVSAELSALNKQGKALEERKKALENEIIVALKGAPMGYLESGVAYEAKVTVCPERIQAGYDFVRLYRKASPEEKAAEKAAKAAKKAAAEAAV